MWNIIKHQLLFKKKRNKKEKPALPVSCRYVFTAQHELLFFFPQFHFSQKKTRRFNSH